MSEDLVSELKRVALAAVERIECLQYQSVLDARSMNAFRVQIAKIADDFNPDSDADAPLALSEIRQALRAVLVASNPVAKEQ
jgi:hypothetical protein